MPKLIDTQARPIDNPWTLLPKDATLEQALAETSQHLLVPAALWNAHQNELRQSGRTIGVWLDSDETAELIAAALPSLPLVALNFPKFMDGRSYSTAVALRQHYHYTGEIRAIGDVLRDQLFYLKRCGFTSFDLQDSVKLEDAQKAVHDYTTSYQSTVEEPLPLFRRRQAG
ncbi:MAG: DUF934 domain-containing protein [Pseudomonadales bacterium]|jgi:uncharacterized protein (DUF934 family)|nr:DUF934 domain-containing protein [Pseudomonadales bacterium]